MSNVNYFGGWRPVALGVCHDVLDTSLFCWS